MDFLGKRMTIERLEEYEQSHGGYDQPLKGSIFEETTVNISKLWLPDIKQCLDRVHKMASDLGLIYTSSDLECSFSGHFDAILQLKHDIEWLLFHDYDIDSNDTLIGYSAGYVESAMPVASKLNNRTVKTEVQLDYTVEDDREMGSDSLTRVVRFKPELVQYINQVHQTQVEEIKETCFVNICQADDGNIEISLSDSMPGTETDVDNAVEQLNTIFSNQERNMSMKHIDLHTFKINDDFIEVIQKQLMDNPILVVTMRQNSSILQIYGESKDVEDATVEAETMLVREAEREKARQVKMELAKEAERKQIQERDAAYKAALAMQHKQALAKEDHVKSVIIQQTNASVELVTMQDGTSHEQPLPPPSTGDDMIDGTASDNHEPKVNGEHSESQHHNNPLISPVDKAATLMSNLPTSYETKNVTSDRRKQNAPKSKERKFPEASHRPSNTRFHDFLSKNYFKLSNAYLFDTIFNGVHITVRRGDISKEPAAVIVSANDVELSCGGVLSSTIDKAGGSMIHPRCIEWMMAYGKPTEGQIVEIDTEGILACNKLFFVVMPNWNTEFEQVQQELQLKQICKNVLQKARDTHNVSSIAIPGLGTGTFYFPCDVYARVMTDALKEFLQAKGRMLEIRFIDLDFRVLQALQCEFQNRLKHPDYTDGGIQLSEIYRQTTDNGQPLPTGFQEKTPPSGFEKIYRRQSSDSKVHERERKWIKKIRTYSESEKSTTFESCILCTRRVSVGFYNYIPCKHIICHLCTNQMESHERWTCPACFKSFSKLHISKF